MKNRHRSKRHKRHAEQDSSAPIKGKVGAESDAQTAEDELTNEKWSRAERIQLWIFIAAIVYAVITAALWWTTREGIHSGQRAYVFVEKVSLDETPTVGHDVRFVIELKNYGGTPANHLATRIRIAIAPSEAEAVADREQANLIGDTPIANGQTRHIFSTNVQGSTTIVTQHMKDAIDAGEPLYISGVMTYVDVFGGSGQTEFCWVTQPKDRQSLTLSLCYDYNAMK